MRRPRVLLLVTLAKSGGAQTYVASLLPALVERFDVAVAAHGPGPLRDLAEAAGARFVSLRHVRRAVRPWRDFLGLLELITLLRRERPDILHANSSKAGVLGRGAAFVARVPIRVFTVHGWAFTAHSGPASRIYRWVERLMSPLTTVTICVSENARAIGLDAGTCRARRTVVISNAVHVGAAPQSSAGGANLRVMTVGRLRAPKDFVTLVRALALLQPGSFEAVIVGDGPDRTAVEAELRRLGLGRSVELAGERSDVPRLLATADVFVLSTTSEGLPVSILEAMAAGLAVVASAVGGIPEVVVDGETGLLVPPGDPERLADALERLGADPALRHRMGAAGWTRVGELFDLPSFHRAHIELYFRELRRHRLATAVPGSEATNRNRPELAVSLIRDGSMAPALNDPWEPDDKEASGETRD